MSDVELVCVQDLVTAKLQNTHIEFAVILWRDGNSLYDIWSPLDVKMNINDLYLEQIINGLDRSNWLKNGACWSGYVHVLGYVQGILRLCFKEVLHSLVARVCVCECVCVWKREGGVSVCIVGVKVCSLPCQHSWELYAISHDLINNSLGPARSYRIKGGIFGYVWSTGVLVWWLYVEWATRSCFRWGMFGLMREQCFVCYSYLLRVLSEAAVHGLRGADSWLLGWW